MAYVPAAQQARKPTNGNPPSLHAGLVTAVRPGTMIVGSAPDAFLLTYFPNGMGNDRPGCQLFSGIEITATPINSADELEILFKTTVDSFPQIKDDATIHKLATTIERVYNDLHRHESMKIETIRVVHHDPAADELRFHVMYIDCPTCHRKTKVVLTWEAVQARSKNPNPIVNMFFKKDKTECGHSFIAFIDRALKVKGCDAVDM